MPEPKSSARTLQEEELNQLLNWLKLNDSALCLAVFLVANTGLHIKEVCDLRWPDINVQGQVIHIHSGGRHRTISMSHTLSTILEDLIADETRTEDRPIKETTEARLSDRLATACWQSHSPSTTFHHLQVFFALARLQTGTTVSELEQI